jgi:hypothetical protein
MYPNRKEEYIASMQNIFRMQVLGTEASPSQSRLYSKKDNDVLHWSLFRFETVHRIVLSIILMKLLKEQSLMKLQER